MGTSAQHMLQALVQGELSPVAMAELAQGKMRPKREQRAQALTGHLQPHHRLLIDSAFSSYGELRAGHDPAECRDCRTAHSL